MVSLICGDSISVMEQLTSESIAVVVTSPPYNLGKDYGVACDAREHNEYLRWSRRWGSEVKRVLADEGSFFLNVAGKPSAPWLPFHLVNLFGDLFTLQNVFHWVKSISLDDGPCRGHVKPINSDRFVNDAHEYLFHFTRRGDTPLNRLAIGVPFADESNLQRGGRGKNGNCRCRGNVWFIPYPTRQSKTAHPCEFPVELPLNCLKLHGVGPGSTVLDPFCGTGATGVAATRQGASFIGIDLNPDYLEEARRRMGGVLDE